MTLPELHRTGGPRSQPAECPEQVLRAGSPHRQGGRPPSPKRDDEEIIASLEGAYPLGRWRSWRRTDVGASNASWFLETDAGSFVLRRSHRLKTAAGARFECALLDLLCQRGFPAPEVQRTSDGDVLVELDGVIHMVMSRLPGSSFDGGSAMHRAVAARGLGRYHTIVSELAAPEGTNRSFALARLGPEGRASLAAAVETVCPRLDADARETLHSRAGYLAGEMVRVEEQLEDRQDVLSTVVVHGSYGPTALLLTDDRLTGVVDFDRAEVDLLGLDLAYALDAFCRPGAVRRMGIGLDQSLTREFLTHYRPEAPASDADLGAVPALFRAQRLGKVLKKCDNVLTTHALAPEQDKHVTNFPRVIERECARVRWLGDNLSTLMEAR